MITYTPGEIAHRDMHQILLSGVAPRPIALVSTVDSNGVANVAPFSFFSAFASKPPIVGIGPAYSALNGKAKDTFLNILETKQCTVNAVTFSMVEQINLASSDYEKSVDEFEISRLTPIDSHVVKAPRVAESPFQLECVFEDHIELGRDVQGNGNLLLLRAVKVHVSESVLTDGKIDPRKMDLVSRLGYNWYGRVTPETVFEVIKPKGNGIGYQALPRFIQESTILSANNVAQLAGVEAIPELTESFSVAQSSADNIYVELQNNNPRGALDAFLNGAIHHHNHHSILQQIAVSFLHIRDVQNAWSTLLYAQKNYCL